MKIFTPKRTNALLFAASALFFLTATCLLCLPVTARNLDSIKAGLAPHCNEFLQNIIEMSVVLFARGVHKRVSSQGVFAPKGLETAEF